MIVMGLEAGTLKKNSTAAGPFARNSTVNHLGAISTVIPALCQLRADKRIDIGKIYEGGSELVRVLIDGHNSIMKAYEYLLNELPRIFTETQTTD